LEEYTLHCFSLFCLRERDIFDKRVSSELSCGHIIDTLSPSSNPDADIDIDKA